MARIVARKSLLTVVPSMSCRHLRLVALVSTSILVMVLGLLPLAQSQSRVGGLQLKPGEKNLASAIIDTANHYAYLGTDTSPGEVVKINLANFTRAGASTFRAGENRVLSAVIDTDNGYAYFGTYTSPGVIVKVRLSDFTRVAALTLGSGEDRLRSAVIDVNHGFAYFGTDTQPGLIVRIRLADFTLVDSLTLNPGEGGLVSALIDPVKGFAYFGTSTSPGRIVKISLPNFARLDALALNQGENALLSAVIDERAGFAYFGTETDPGIVVKVRLADFTRVDTLSLFVGEGGLSSGVIDPEHDAAYFGTDTASAGTTVVKITLSNLSRVAAITMASAEVVLRSAAFDSSAGFAYFGTYTDPGIVVKVNVLATPLTTAIAVSTTSIFRSSAQSGSSQELVFGVAPISFLGAVGLLVAGVVTSSALIIVIRKRGKPSAVALSTTISTGYPDLDVLLHGGIPEGYSVLLISPSYDERDLLLRKLIHSSLSSEMQVFYISGDLRKTLDMLGTFREDFYGFCTETAKMPPTERNLYMVPGIGNLVEFNIVLNKALAELVRESKTRILILDVLSDILLAHKALTTRRWLSDFLSKRRAQGFTMMASLNPLMVPKEESDRILDIFDGVIEVYEKETQGRMRRFLIVKKMYGKKYSESEHMVDKDKLF